MSDKSFKRIKRERLCKYIQRSSKYEYNNPNDKEFWKTSIDDLEQESIKVLQSNCFWWYV